MRGGALCHFSCYLGIRIFRFHLHQQIVASETRQAIRPAPAVPDFPDFGTDGERQCIFQTVTKRILL
jgi:hypothetical protein